MFIYIHLFFCDSIAGSAERTRGANNYGTVNTGYEFDRPNGRDQPTEMVTFKANPAQTPGITINDSSVTKVSPAKIMYFFLPVSFVVKALHVTFVVFFLFNPFTPRSDQHINSPYNFNTLSSKQVMGIKKIIN